MAREDVRKTLAKQSLGTKLALLVGALVVVGLVYWQFFYSPLRGDVDRAESRHEDLVDENSRLVDREHDYARLIEQRDELEDDLRESLVSLPVAAELPAFFVHLQRQASSAGIDVHTWSRRDEEPVADYMKVPVDMEVRGTFQQIMHYFKLVHETERVITIEDLTLASPQAHDDELLLAAEFTAATFRQAGDNVLAELGMDRREEPEEENGEAEGENEDAGGAESDEDAE